MFEVKPINMSASIRFRHLSLPLWLSFVVSSTAFAQSQDPEKPKQKRNKTRSEVTVTGSRVATDNQDLPADVKVTSRARIHLPTMRSAPSALSDVSGVKLNPRQDNATFSDIEVRGLAGNATSGGNVLILLDGIPQRRLSFGGPYMGVLPFDSVVRMELVKGPASSLYGRNALAGALQLFTDPGAYDPHVEVSALYEYPSNTIRSGIVSSGPLSSKPLGGDRLPTYSLSGSLGYTGGWQPRTQTQKNDLYLHSVVPLSRQDQLTILGGFFDGREAAASPVFVDKNGNRVFGLSRDDNLAVPGQNSLGACRANAI
jgi:outer membrane receptor for ferrienterochelin and colicin